MGDWFFLKNPSDQLLSLPIRCWFYQRWQHLSQTFEHRHTCAAAVQQSCTSSRNLGLDFALGWQRCKSRAFVLPKCWCPQPVRSDVFFNHFLTQWLSLPACHWAGSDLNLNQAGGLVYLQTGPAQTVVWSCLFRGCTQWHSEWLLVSDRWTVQLQPLEDKYLV